MSVLSLVKKNKLKDESIFLEVLLHLVFIVVIIFCISPLLLVIGISFTDENALLESGYNFIPKVFSLRAYEFVMASKDTIWRAYGISVVVTLIGTCVSLLTISMYAYPLSRPNFKYRGKFAFIAYFTMIFGGGIVPWYVMYTQVIPIRGSLLIYIVPLMMNAWYVMIMRTFIKTTVHDSIIESAKIDGAGEFRTFFQIVIPSCRAGLATIGLFCCLNYWNDYFIPLVFVQDAKLYNMQFLMYQTLITIQSLSSGSINFADSGQSLMNMPSEGARMAVAVISIGPIILAYPFFQQYFIKGLTIGAVKG